MDAEVKNEEVTDDSQIPIEPKQEIDESLKLIESKVELIDEKDVKTEEIDDNEYQHIIPYEYRDFLEQHTEKEPPTSSRKRPADDSSMSKKNTIKCLKCGKEISLSPSTNVNNHAIRHTGLKMYECPANQCDYKAHDKLLVSYHMNRNHKSCSDPVQKYEMSDEEIQVLKNMMHECFPGLYPKKMPAPDNPTVSIIKKGAQVYPAPVAKKVVEKQIRTGVICQLCHQGVNNWEQARRDHSNKHIYPRIFKCDQQSCNYSSNLYDSFASHDYFAHQKSSNPDHRDHFIMHQETEMQKWNDMCFSSKVEDSTETIDYPASVSKIAAESKKHAEYRDYLDQHNEEEQPTNSRKRPAEEKKMLVDCQKCGNGILLTSFTEAKEHAATHTDLKSFTCEQMVDEFFPGFIEQLLQKTDEKDVKIEDDIPFEYNEYTDQQPTNSRKRPAADSSIPEGNSSECQKCGISVSSHLQRHAIRHTDLKMYECPASQCRFRAYDSKIVTGHMRRTHTFCSDPVRKIEMSNEQKEKLDNMVQDCFPKLDKDLFVTCQLCHRSVKNCEKARRTHSNGHIYPRIFECDQQGCDFSTNLFDSFAMHTSIKHQKACHPDYKTHLIMKQEREMQKWNGMCFSSKDVKKDSTETVDFPRVADEKSEEMVNDGQIPMLIEPKQEVEDTVELFEPKIELIDEMDVKIEEEIEDNEYQHTIPYEYRDYLEQYIEEEQPTNSRNIPAEEEKMLVDCQKCGNGILLTSFTEAKEHAATHTDLKSFKCEQMIDECFPGFIEQLLQKTDENEVKIEDDIPFEYDDYTDQQPTNTRKNWSSKFKKKDSIECLKCGKEVFLSNMSNVKNHAILHTSLKIYECPAKHCNFGANDSRTVTYHIKRMHNSYSDPVRKNEISDEDKQVLDDMMHECFPELQTMKFQNVLCQFCHHSVKDLKRAKRNHSIGHIDPLLFKCNEEDCDFSTNWFDFFSKHVYLKHQKSFKHKDRKQLLMKQEMKMQKWNDICFSNIDVTEEDLTETIDYPAPVAKKLTAPKKQMPDATQSTLFENTVLVQDGHTCQICKKTITEDGCDTVNRLIHASEHMDILFCSAPGCQFQTKYLVAMNNHQLTVHVSEPASSSGTSLRFMTAQEWGIERMLGRCFPELIKK